MRFLDHIRQPECLFTLGSVSVTILALCASTQFGDGNRAAAQENFSTTPSVPIWHPAVKTISEFPTFTPTSATDVSAAEVQAPDVPEIEGGQEDTGPHSWIGGLYDRNGNFMCAFVYTDAGREVGLTQAHCLVNKDGSSKHPKQARFCVHDKSSSEGQWIDIVDTVVLDEYFTSGNTAETDIGYIYLAQAPSCGAAQIPIIRAGESGIYEPNGQTIKIRGWGSSSTPHDDKLWVGETQLVDSYEGCTRTDRQLCGLPGTAGIRDGDSGGDGTSVVVSNDVSTMRLVAINSRFYANTLKSILTRLSGLQAFLQTCNHYGPGDDNPRPDQCSKVMGNTPPEVNDDSAFAQVGHSAQGNVLDNDSDLDQDPLEVDSYSYTDPADEGSVVIYDTGYFVANSSEANHIEVRVNVHDDKGARNTSTLTINFVEACAAEAGQGCGPTPTVMVTATPTDQAHNNTATWTPHPDHTSTPGGPTATWTPDSTPTGTPDSPPEATATWTVVPPPVPTIDRTRMPLENDVHLPVVSR